MYNLFPPLDQLAKNNGDRVLREQAVDLVVDAVVFKHEIGSNRTHLIVLIVLLGLFLAINLLDDRFEVCVDFEHVANLAFRIAEKVIQDHFVSGS